MKELLCKNHPLLFKTKIQAFRCHVVYDKMYGVMLTRNAFLHMNLISWDLAYI